MKPPKSGVSSCNQMSEIQQNWLLFHWSLDFQVMASFILLTNALEGHKENFNREHKHQTEQCNFVSLPLANVFG